MGSHESLNEAQAPQRVGFRERKHGPWSLRVGLNVEGVRSSRPISYGLPPPAWSCSYPRCVPSGALQEAQACKGSLGATPCLGVVGCLWGWSAGHPQSSSYPWHPAPVASTLGVRGQVWTSACPMGSDPRSVYTAQQRPVSRTQSELVYGAFLQI